MQKIVYEMGYPPQVIQNLQVNNMDDELWTYIARGTIFVITLENTTLIRGPYEFGLWLKEEYPFNHNKNRFLPGEKKKYFHNSRQRRLLSPRTIICKLDGTSFNDTRTTSGWFNKSITPEIIQQFITSCDETAAAVFTQQIIHKPYH